MIASAHERRCSALPSAGVGTGRSRTVASADPDAAVRLRPVPTPADGTAEHLRSWAEAITGLELDPGGVPRPLAPAEWEARR